MCRNIFCNNKNIWIFIFKFIIYFYVIKFLLYKKYEILKNIINILKVYLVHKVIYIIINILKIYLT